MVVVGEVLPLAPIIGEGAGALISLLAFGACVGLAYAWRHTFGDALEWMAGKFDALSFHIPFAGRVRPLGPIAHAFRSVDHSIQHNLAAAAAATGHAFHACFNQLAHDAEALAGWVEHYSASIASAFTRVHTVVLPRWGRHAARYARHVAWSAAHRLTRPILLRIHAAEHLLRHLTRAVAHADTTAAHALGYAEKWVGRTAKQARAETRRLRRLEELTLGAGAAVLVATALGRLGLRWLRCPSLGRLGRKIGCGGFGFLEALLAAEVDVLTVTELCPMVSAFTAAAQDAAPAIEHLANGIDGLIECQGASRPKPLKVKWYAPPTATATVAL